MHIHTIESIMEMLKSAPDIYNKINKSTLAIREELVSLQALNPYAAHNSASRGLMQTGQFAQLAVLINPEPKIIQEGITEQLTDNTWKCRVERDCIVKAIIASNDSHDIENTETIILVVEYLNGELDIIDVPLFYFVTEYGFRYKRNIELLSNISVGSRLNEGTVLAETPGVVDGTYSYGINADMKLVTHPDVGQDGIVVSEELMQKMAHKVYSKFECNISNDKIMLNVYGDENNYLPLPKVGDTIGPDSIVMALRELSPDDIPPSVYDTMDIDPIYDECFYTKHPTKAINLNGKSVINNKVVSVKVYKSPSKKDTNLHGKESLDGIAENIKQIHRRIVSTYNKHSDDKNITPRASKTIVESMAISSTDIKSELRYRNESFITRVEVVVETTVIPGVGSKISDLNGVFLWKIHPHNFE